MDSDAPKLERLQYRSGVALAMCRYTTHRLKGLRQGDEQPHLTVLSTMEPLPALNILSLTPSKNILNHFVGFLSFESLRFLLFQFEIMRSLVSSGCDL